MDENITKIDSYDLEKIEKKAFSSIFQDGIFDMILGYILVSYSLSTYLFDSLLPVWRAILSLIIYCIGIIGLFLCKRYVTQPRMGTAIFGYKRRNRQRILVIMTSILVVLTLVIMILTMTDTFQLGSLGYGTAAIFGGSILLFFMGLAFMLDFNRLYLTGSLFAIAIGLNEVFFVMNKTIYGYISQWTIGGIIMGIGITYFIIFLTKHPIKARENNE
ncbi:MAG: hypothetical protein ACFFDW_08380 [Candidatus Thorarchaeota archaeon]